MRPDRQRYWSGSVWTKQVREPPMLSGASRPVQAPASGVSAQGSDQEAERSRTTMMIMALGVLVLVVGMVVLVVLRPGLLGEDARAGDGHTATQESEEDRTGDATTSEDRRDDPAAEQPGSAAPNDPLRDLDVDAADLLIDLGTGTEPVTLQGGSGQLADGRTIRRVPQLTARGDLTGDGRDELVLAISVEGPTGDGDDQPALAVLRDDAEPGSVAVAPPVLGLPDRSGPWEPLTIGSVEALGIHQGGIEVAVVAARPGRSTLALSEDRADPLVENYRPELRFDFAAIDGSWIASADGPVTQAARSVAIDAGVEVDDVLCDGRARPRGGTMICAGAATDGSSTRTEVVLLAVDDHGGARAVVGQPAPVATASEVRRLLGPGEHFCRDIAALAAGDDRPWALPMAAVAYWFDDGMPARMDASQNGIPCQTVFDDVAAFLNGSDSVVRPYSAPLRP